MKFFVLIKFMFICFIITGCSHASKVDKTNLIKAHKKICKDKNAYLILIDPGHGGFDMGANFSTFDEKTINLQTACLIKKHLSNMGYKVIMTRSTDVFIPLVQRVTIANKAKAHLFLSVHYNAAENSEATGIEVFYYDSFYNKYKTNLSKKLANLVLSKMTDRTGAKSRGVKKGDFHVIKESKMPAVLIEGGFITHQKERSKLKSQNYISQIAIAISEGVDKYCSSF